MRMSAVRVRFDLIYQDLAPYKYCNYYYYYYRGAACQSRCGQDSTNNHKIALKVIEGNTNAVKYWDEILRDVTLPFQQANPEDNFILADGNATSHRARIHVTGYKQANNIITEEWPARTDMNVTRARLGYAPEGRQRPTTSCKQPGRALQGCSRRMGQVGTEQTETAGPQCSKQVPRGHSDQGRRHPLLTAMAAPDQAGNVSD